MFVIDFKTVFHTLFLGMLMIYLHTKFNMPSSNASLVFTNARFTYNLDTNVVYFKVSYYEGPHTNII